MSDHPSPPPEPDLPPRRINRRELWSCLLLPTLATLVAALITPLGGHEGYAYRLWFLALVTGPIVGFICTPWFVKLMQNRYHGRSLTLISIGYAFGQLILTPAIGFGGCMLVANTYG